MTSPLSAESSAVEPAAVEPRRRGFGVAALVLGILLVVGVVLWLLVGTVGFVLLVWVFPLLVIAAIVIGSIHLVVAALATVFGVLAIVRNRGRAQGIVGLVLTLLATAVTVLFGFFFVQLASVLFTGVPAS